MPSEPIKVMLVEDDEDDFVMTRDLLREVGQDRYALDWFPDYDAALAQARANSHDVYLVDYRLGANDGVRFVREAVTGGCHSPLILLTGQPDRDIDMAAMAAGAEDFLNKSGLTASALERSIRYAIQKKRSEEQRLEVLRAEAARAEAERANRMKDDFLATLSHELRTPLNAILGWAQMLRMANLDPDTSAQAVEAIERNAKSQAQLINDLLDVSRIISGKIRLERRLVSLPHVVASAVESVRPMAESKAITLTVDTGDLNGDARVFGDATRLQQVIWNLLSNSIKFTPDSGHVDVRLRRSGGLAEVVIRDNGRGIRPDLLSVIFERFRQADSSSTRVHAGLGLGLAIVRHLTELHGGSVRAYSDGEGHGATFTVELPLASEAEIHAVAAAARPNGASRLGVRDPLRGLRVLVLDDEPDARKYVAKALAISGADAIPAGTADEAIEKIQQGDVDVIVSDIAMPREDGYAFLRRVRSLSNDHGGSTPAIALTAYASEQDKERSLAAGFQIHVSKPVEAADLVSAVALAAGRRVSR